METTHGRSQTVTVILEVSFLCEGPILITPGEHERASEDTVQGPKRWTIDAALRIEHKMRHSPCHLDICRLRILNNAFIFLVQYE
jgi:hypothetical protein